jgi:3-oxoacyl-[acyl-carrier-protein] synthase III
MKSSHGSSGTGASGAGVSGAGVSGMAVYVPRFRVRLEAWCDWTKNSWDKVKSVAGHSFRILGPREDLYTMAANASLRLIRQYGIDPKQVGFLGLGTESSKDNSAGAVIVRGMLDEALTSTGAGSLSRNLEVPEFKHACLGGVYALKGAQRYVTSDGRGRVAIVVCGDIAEYERGSTGEQTQGAGAVAMLVEPETRMLRVDLAHAVRAALRSRILQRQEAHRRLPGVQREVLDLRLPRRSGPRGGRHARQGRRRRRRLLSEHACPVLPSALSIHAPPGHGLSAGARPGARPGATA